MRANKASQDTRTETSTSEWTLLNYGDEEEEIEIVGFAITNVDGETTLDYDSDFSFNLSTTIETTSDDSSMLLDTDVTSTNISLVDSLHTTHDTYLVERELEEGEVVETTTRDYSGSFSTDAHMTSNTDTLVEGSYDLSISTSGGGGGPPPGPGMPPPPTTPPMSIETHITWSDDRSSTTTTIADQSGSYGDDEEDSSSSSLSVTSVDEYFSTMEGTDARDIDGYITSGNFTHEREGSSEHQFHDSKSYSSEGNEASWSTSYETENSWTIHAEITEFGYTIIVDDSDSDSYSESSGGQSYEPGEEDNPSNGYRPPVGTYGGGEGGGSEGGEGLEDSELGEFVRRGPAWDLMKRFMTRQWSTQYGHLEKLPHFIDPYGNGDAIDDDLVDRWYFGHRREDGFVNLTAGEGSLPDGHHIIPQSLWDFMPQRVKDIFDGLDARIANEFYNGHNFGTYGGVSHAAYNKAVDEELTKFLIEEGGISRSRMTSEQAKRFLQRIKSMGEDTLIGKFNKAVAEEAAKFLKDGKRALELAEKAKKGLASQLELDELAKLAANKRIQKGLLEKGISVISKGGKLILKYGGSALKVGGKLVAPLLVIYAMGEAAANGADPQEVALAGAAAFVDRETGELIFQVVVVTPNGVFYSYLIQDGNGVLRRGAYGQFPDIAAETERYLEEMKKNPPKYQDDRTFWDLLRQSFAGDWGFDQTPPGGTNLRRKHAP